jgi:hypothetical protein
MATKTQQYYIDNKESINSRALQRYYDNIDDRKLKHKQYYQKNKDKLLKMAKTKQQCECGSFYCYSTKTRHMKTKKHRKYEQKKNRDSLNKRISLEFTEYRRLLKLEQDEEKKIRTEQDLLLENDKQPHIQAEDWSIEELEEWLERHKPDSRVDDFFDRQWRYEMREILYNKKKDINYYVDRIKEPTTYYKLKNDIKLNIEKKSDKEYILACEREKKIREQYGPKKVYLRVPYKDKDSAKNVKAQWDPKKKLWFIYSDNIDYEICIKNWGM